MYVSPTSIRLLTGRSTPTTRAMLLTPNLEKQFSVFGPRRRPETAPYPCRCLCLGFVQITRTTPLRWMILQLSHIFLTDALTFISHLPRPAAGRGLLVPVSDP